MNHHTPLGFYVASIAAAGFGVLMLALVAGPEGVPPDGAVIVARAAAALLVAVAAVTAEALWMARRWAYRASLSLALGYAALVTFACVQADGATGLGLAFWLLLFSAMVVVPILLYVRSRSIALFGIPRPPVPAPRYRPPPAAPAPPRIGPGGRPVPWW